MNHIKTLALFLISTGAMSAETLETVTRDALKKGQWMTRPFEESDRGWAIEGCVKTYSEMYKDEPYYWGTPPYQFLSATDEDAKKETLTTDGNTMISLYLNNPDTNYHGLALYYNDEHIGGLWYRTMENKSLIIDEFVFIKEVSSDLKKYVLEDFLRKLSPGFKTYSFTLRPINRSYVQFFHDLGYKPQTTDQVKLQGDDPVLYMGMSKIYD